MNSSPLRVSLIAASLAAGLLWHGAASAAVGISRDPGGSLIFARASLATSS